MNALEQQNRELKRTLRLMAKKAEDNEAILAGFFALELKLMRCQRMQELVTTVLVDMCQHFHICSADLLLLDPEQSARQMVDAGEIGPKQANIRFLDDLSLLQQLFPRKQMVLGPVADNPLFSQHFSGIRPSGSSVLLPLTHGEYLIGALHLHSQDPERYSLKYRYDYIVHTAEVISICLENCMNNENLHRLSMRDRLTGVMNRHCFDQDILLELGRASREETAISCLFLDLDHFKRVNDTFGHLSGDQALRTVGQLLKNAVRQADCVARYGGEEFAVLLPGCDEIHATALAEQLRQKLEGLVFRSDNGHPFQLTTSIGICTCQPSTLQDWELAEIANELVHAADTALYQAKERGRNQAQVAAFPHQPSCHRIWA